MVLSGKGSEVTKFRRYPSLCFFFFFENLMRLEEEQNGECLMDTVFEFLEEGEGEGSDRSSDGSYRRVFDGGLDSDGDETESGAAGNKAFWETQHRVLQESLSRTTSTETKIRQRTEHIVRKMRSAVPVCSCSNQSTKDCCRNCALKHIAEKLREAGHNSALCKSKWRRSPDIPSGEHSYVDVVAEAKNGKKGAMRVVIELNFRAEFEMARGSREYNSLVNNLPEVFVGKAERLKGVVKIVCDAAKRCMKENRMHMGPWRKHKYMQSKWLETPERIVPQPWAFVPPVPATGPSERQQPKLRASMLTFDLHCSTAVEVV